MRAHRAVPSKLFAAWLGALLPLSVGAQERPPRSLTLDEAIELALESHPQVVAARGEVVIEGAHQREAVGRWLPSVSASSGMSKSSSTRYNSITGQNVTASSPFSYSAGLNASFVVFDGMRRIHEGRAADANSARAEASLVDRRFQVTLQTKQAFYDVVYAAELEGQAGRQVQRARQQLDLSRDRLAAGTVIRSDTLRATVEHGNARLALLTARARRATAEAMLGRLVGLDEAIRIVVDSSVLAMPVIDTAAIRAEAIENSPSIAEADAALLARRAQVGAAGGERFPRISAGLSTFRTGTALDAMNPSWSLGFSLSWSLFDGFAREAGLAGAQAELRTAVAAAEDARRQVNVRLTEQLANLATARAQLEIALASQVAAEEDVRVQQERYRQGVGTIVEVLVAQQSLAQSEVAGVDARRAYHVAKANIEALVGRELCSHTGSYC